MRTIAAAGASLALSLTLAGCGASTRETVPNVAGQRLDVAQDTLDAAGLRYDTIGGGAFGIVVRSHWTVCRQAPAAGTTAHSVTLYVDVGRTCPAAPPPIAPDVIDEQLEDAREELEADGFTVVARSVDGDPIHVEQLWTVCDQSPEPGQRGRRIVLEVAHDCWDYS